MKKFIIVAMLFLNNHVITFTAPESSKYMSSERFFRGDLSHEERAEQLLCDYFIKEIIKRACIPDPKEDAISSYASKLKRKVNIKKSEIYDQCIEMVRQIRKYEYKK